MQQAWSLEFSVPPNNVLKKDYATELKGNIWAFHQYKPDPGNLTLATSAESSLDPKVSNYAQIAGNSSLVKQLT
jgi:hypothetical protein